MDTPAQNGNSGPPPPAGLRAKIAAWPRWRKMAAGSLLGIAILAGGLAGVLMAFMEDLPAVPDPEEQVVPSQATRLYDIRGQLITQLAIENRTIVRLDQMPKQLVDAITALEDRRFHSHWGVDPWGILRAAIVNLKAGRVIEGGSTITQQLAKNLFLTRERKFSRKIQEALLALQIERRYTKNEILQLYFNLVYFGNGAYGVEAAARTYFGKHAAELSLGECATLAGIPKSPNKNNPIDDPKQAAFRRDTTLRSMLETGAITKEEHDAAAAEPIQVFQADPVVAAYFVEHVRQQLEAAYGSNAVYKGGLTVYTTLDLRLQDIAQTAAERGAREADIKALPFLEHEFQLKEKPVLQLAFLAMDPRSGQIRAMVGGRDFKRFQFNRATQARRQPGSAFKPFIYTTAIENGGFNAADPILDAPAVWPDAKGKPWKPENFDLEFRGPTLLARGLAESRNVVTVKLLEKVGIYNAVNCAHKMGIQSPLNRDLTLALGTSEVSLLELVNGFSTLAGQGVRVEPVAILSVRDAEGKLLEEAVPHATEALSPATAYIITSMLQEVINSGTASHLRTSLGFTRTAAGKTGTTSDFSDAWFVGYTPSLAAGCWFGYDQRRRIGKLLTGGAIAAPVWAEFMAKALEGQADEAFPIPPGIQFAKLCWTAGLGPHDPKCRRVVELPFAGEPPAAVEQGDEPDPNIFLQHDLGGSAAPKAAAPAGRTGTAKPGAVDALPADGSMGF